jgi:hypothetical protein
MWFRSLKRGWGLVDCRVCLLSLPILLAALVSLFLALDIGQSDTSRLCLGGWRGWEGLERSGERELRADTTSGVSKKDGCGRPGHLRAAILQPL